MGPPEEQRQMDQRDYGAVRRNTELNVSDQVR